MEVSMKKHKAFVSAAKLGIAKNTRGAQKRRVNNWRAEFWRNRLKIIDEKFMI